MILVEKLTSALSTLAPPPKIANVYIDGGFYFRKRCIYDKGSNTSRQLQKD
jgi:hypothetical protein